MKRRERKRIIKRVIRRSLCKEQDPKLKKKRKGKKMKMVLNHSTLNSRSTIGVHPSQFLIQTKARL